MARSDIPFTYLGAVPTWEIDRNEHWNVRFYHRAFQVASEVFALSQTGRNPGVGTASARHIRFYREVRLGEGVSVRTGRVVTGRFAGAIAHLMSSEGRLAAAALDRPGYAAEAGPAWEEAEVVPALPRTLAADPDGPGDVSAAGCLEAITGVIRPDEVDHTGDVTMHNIFAHTSTGSQNLLLRMGYTPAYSREHRRNRMAVEARIVRQGPCRPGDALRVRSCIAAVAAKTFSLRHDLSNAVTGAAVASAEICLLNVNLDTRRADDLPDFVRRAFEMQQEAKV